MHSRNLCRPLPDRQAQEAFETLLQSPTVRIERIVSHGHASPADFWYDQEEAEWVLLVQGNARLAFADGRETALEAGDYVHIPAHCRHRVVQTDPNMPTVWLAVFYTEPEK
ncbi:cupin domain-containing protein [Uruburuella suis]|uniref:Cupin 2 domain-containing protein n=1 Tax=Uruburuella suis TaxID=252130 RepID=A0AAE9GU32_9NEIS|nr:cupin domain-containing protein [Uruburuella suis]TCP09177.1 cupin 2 domain-containing protein [Uruburuella suis]UOO79056.1 cupin domain-containing protein [Uruburuella suis]